MELLDVVHYGACVTLSLTEGAYLYSKGFTDSAAYIERFPSDIEFSMAVFRVLPSCTYSIQREVLGALTKTTTSEHIALLEESLEGEMKTNIQTYSACKGTPVKFGSLVQLEHVSSRKYLTVQSHEIAETERDHLRVSLEDFGSELALFRIEAAYQFQSAGDQCVRYGDQVKICTYVQQFSKTAFLHSSANPRSVSAFATIMTFAESRRESQLEERFEVNASLEHPSLWTLRLFSPFIPENSPNLLVGDSVWFTNSELDNILAGDGEIVDVRNSGDTNGLWVLEDNEETKGGQVMLGRPYRLRHLSTGLYLAVHSRQEHMGGPTAFAAVIAHLSQSIEEPTLTFAVKRTDYSLWTFEGIASRRSTKCLLKDEFFKLKNTAIGLYLHFQMREDTVQSLVSGEEADSNVFKVTKCEEALLLETKFLINSLPLLRRFPRFIERHSEEDPELLEYREFKKFMNLIRKTIRDLHFFCENKLTSLVAFTKQYGRVETARQRLLREQKCLEALAGLLENAFIGRFDLERSIHIDRSPEHERQISADYDQAESKELRELAEQAYMLIDSICKDNLDNQRYAYQFFPLFQKQAPYIINCIPCMVTIMSGSEELLLKAHRVRSGPDTVISHFIGLLQDPTKRRPQLLRFLQCLCCYKSAGLNANQEQVHEHLFASGSNAVIETAV